MTRNVVRSYAKSIELLKRWFSAIALETVQTDLQKNQHLVINDYPCNETLLTSKLSNVTRCQTFATKATNVASHGFYL